MIYIIWEIFTKEWLKRSRRRGKGIDDVDRFICLWIAFNGWMRGKYGENLNDAAQKSRVKQNQDLEQTFDMLNNISPSFSELLNKLRQYTVANMLNPDNRNLMRRYDGSLTTLIDVIYLVRCNLFHGRKNIQDNMKDFELVVLSYRIMQRLFVEYLKSYEPGYLG